MDFIWASVCINTLFMINCQQKNEFSESFEVGICIILKSSVSKFFEIQTVVTAAQLDEI